MDDLILYDIDPDDMTEEEKERIRNEFLYDEIQDNILLEENLEKRGSENK